MNSVELMFVAAICAVAGFIFGMYYGLWLHMRNTDRTRNSFWRFFWNVQKHDYKDIWK